MDLDPTAAEYLSWSLNDNVVTLTNDLVAIDSNVPLNITFMYGDEESVIESNTVSLTLIAE